MEGLDTEGTQADITVSDSDEEYPLVNYPDGSSSKHSEVNELNVASTAVPVK